MSLMFGTGRSHIPSPTRLALAATVLYLPFIGLGYGTDIDITNIRRSGESILAGDYRYSRPPGAFPHELITGVLDRLGAAWLVNLGSVVMAVVTLVALGRLVERHHGPRAGRIAVVVVATQPWFWVVASSLGDYLYALGFLLLGIDAAQRDRRWWAAAAFGASIGFRSMTALLVAAYLLAEVTGAPASGDDGDAEDDPVGRPWADVIRTGAGAALIGLAWFIPPWLSVGRTARFLENQFQTGDIAVMIARWGVKNIAFFGLVTVVLLLIRAPVLWAAVRQFRHRKLVRFALYAALLTEAVYLRFPWKPAHLLPMVVCLAILLAVSPLTSNRLVGAVVASQLLLAVVSITVAEPDVADAATTGSFSPGLTKGVVVNELDCRLDPAHVDPSFDPDSPAPSGDWPDLTTPEADFAAVRVFACQARSWRAGAGPSVVESDATVGVVDAAEAAEIHARTIDD